MNDDCSTEFSYADEYIVLDELLERTDDSVLMTLETALEHDVGLAHIFELYPSRARRRYRGEGPRVTRDRPPQNAIADQQHGSQRP